MGTCTGNCETHCCWLSGTPCQYLEEYTVPDRHWACGLMRKYDSDWDTVVASTEYVDNIEPHFGPQGITCKDWPDMTKGQYCGDCGQGCD